MYSPLVDSTILSAMDSPKYYCFESGTLRVYTDMQPETGKTFTFKAKNGDIFEADKYVRRQSLIADTKISDILRMTPKIDMTDDTVVVTFTKGDEFVRALMIKQDDPVADLNAKLAALTAHIEQLEANARLECERSSVILSVLIATGFHGNDFSYQMPMLLDLLKGANLSTLAVNARHCITWESDVFERMVSLGYDLRNIRGVEQAIQELINFNWLYPWNDAFELGFARIIALANVDWSTTEEKHVDWNRILISLMGELGVP